MAAADLWAQVKPYADRLAVWRGYEQELQTLAIYGIGIAVYTALVFAFYQSLSRRRPVHIPGSEDDGWWGRTARFFERALLFPVVSFLYFAVIAVALFVLAQSQTTQDILRIAMAVVVSVRVTVYLSEKMSNDLAKLVPLSLLAVMLVNPTYASWSATWGHFAEATRLWPLLGRYFLLFIALEAAFSSARWVVMTVASRMRGDPGRGPAKEEAKESMFSVAIKGPPAKPPLQK